MSDDTPRMPSQWNLVCSHFASILETNHIPSTNELTEMKASLVEPAHNELSRRNWEIARVQGILETLSSERDQIQ